MERSWLNLCVECLYVLYWALSGDLRTKILEKHGQSQGYKSISRDLDILVYTARNVIKKFTAHGSVDNLPGCGRKRKIDESLQRRIVWMVNKEPWSTSKQIQADLQTQGTTVSARTICRHLNEMGRYGRRLRRTHPTADTEAYKSQTRVCQNLPQEAKILHVDRPKSFLVKHIIVLFTENEMRPSKKRTRSLLSNMEEVHRCFGVAFLLLAPDALTVCMASWNLKTTKELWSAM